ncbi:proton-conducting membrane transporter [Haloarcula nitratireducens]|uniref:Proton-conducting membrane transporter n=1 Tax=Haloarcula nitratireducens TaxID=2487749 RepID=A0AAW4P9Z6_9EURY|nr:proton-conducting membrane transporter [Halomicroarcula nitratireducens]MBX0294721.1 proton-conducting membrane transporter [Halomicroarcula nitratireducens]
MTNRPELNTEGNYVAGLAAVALFVVLGAVFIGVSFPTPTGFGEGAAITKSLGAAMFDIAPGAIMGDGETAVPAEGFLVAFILIGVVLDAALDGAVMLAKREDAGENVGPDIDDAADEATVAADGGEAVETGGDDA